jgi:hypothetical protein
MLQDDEIDSKMTAMHSLDGTIDSESAAHIQYHELSQFFPGQLTAICHIWQGIQRIWL